MHSFLLKTLTGSLMLSLLLSACGGSATNTSIPGVDDVAQRAFTLDNRGRRGDRRARQRPGTRDPDVAGGGAG
ncbi:hypothetical protein [Deinococcus hopiensis]|uniref:Uncharacterized protein n=1 Tax=Deinococcus hopiensis KR-140 TaxID=695939 RepID=A0A1W1VB12_9DEIO|nr:hypothetical protein [Deinococcus hopiensis]SMB90241.1 hypothetical protein SAMN00790413_00694 [Deinococcus hopiensis KR-140]